MAKSTEYREFVEDNLKGNQFCVGMIQKLFSCSLNFLYRRSVNPEYLGGEWMKHNPRPAVTPHLPPLKPLLESSTVTIEALAELKCCQRKPCCTQRLTVKVMNSYREEFATASKVSSACCLIVLVCFVFVNKHNTVFFAIKPPKHFFFIVGKEI
jgi:hypothetical protein